MRPRCSPRSPRARPMRFSPCAEELSRPLVRRRQRHGQRGLEDVEPQPVRHTLSAWCGPTPTPVPEPLRRRLHQGLRGRPPGPAGRPHPPRRRRLPAGRAGAGRARVHHAARRLGLAAYKEVLDEHGILLISDEVQTGWGRTGEHFPGISAHGIVRTQMTFAKGLGNGFAIGGVVARGDLLDGIRGNGISTFWRQSDPDHRGQRHPRLRALPRPAAQRRGHREPDHQRTDRCHEGSRHSSGRARPGA